MASIFMSAPAFSRWRFFRRGRRISPSPRLTGLDAAALGAFAQDAVSRRGRRAGENGSRSRARARAGGTIHPRYSLDVRDRTAGFRGSAFLAHRPPLPGAASPLAGSRPARPHRTFAIDAAAFSAPQDAQFRRHEMEEIPLSSGLRVGRLYALSRAGLFRLRRFRVLLRLRGRRRATDACLSRRAALTRSKSYNNLMARRPAGPPRASGQIP